MTPQPIRDKVEIPLAAVAVGSIGRQIRRIDQRWCAPNFARRLAPRLLRDYGASKFCTPGQIQAACAKCGLPRRQLALAYAAFLPQAEFESATDATVWPDYVTLRALFFRFARGGEDFRSLLPRWTRGWAA
jgi:hypothetical protein